MSSFGGGVRRTEEECPCGLGFPPSILWIGPSKGTHFDGASSEIATDY